MFGLYHLNAVAGWRSAIAVGAVGALLAAAVWTAGSSGLLRSGRLTALRHISAPTASQPSPAPISQSVRLQTSAPPRAVSLGPPSSAGSPTCQPWQVTLTLNGFVARVIAPGTVVISWSASDRCPPPYTGSIRAAFTGVGINGPFQTSYTVKALSGSITEKFDCSTHPVTGAIYFLGLWDSANHQVTATTSVAVC
jgi:hypothetical protein